MLNITRQDAPDFDNSSTTAFTKVFQKTSICRCQEICYILSSDEVRLLPDTAAVVPRPRNYHRSQAPAQSADHSSNSPEQVTHSGSSLNGTELYNEHTMNMKLSHRLETGRQQCISL